jgi:gamma-glutamyl:cysteine ligase YbdK (ATP-grasp superfamily)
MEVRTIGVERERFIYSPAKCLIVNAIRHLLPAVHGKARSMAVPDTLFQYEMAACQIEDKTPVCTSLKGLHNALVVNDAILIQAAKLLGLRFWHDEFVDVSRIERLEVNPFSERHADIWRSISVSQRTAASQVIGTHVHIGVSPEEALRTLDRCTPDILKRLIRLGDHSDGKRIAAYQTMAGINGTVPTHATFSDLMDYIIESGGERNVWDWVRYKPSTQTLEFRMFGATSDIDEVIGYARACLEIVS